MNSPGSHNDLDVHIASPIFFLKKVPNERQGVRSTYHSTINRGDRTSQRKLAHGYRTAVCCVVGCGLGCYHLRCERCARRSSIFPQNKSFSSVTDITNTFKQTADVSCVLDRVSGKCEFSRENNAPLPATRKLWPHRIKVSVFDFFGTFQRLFCQGVVQKFWKVDVFRADWRFALV